MASSSDEVRSMLSLIESARLPHPSGLLLSSFVKEAINPRVAARYVQERVDGGGEMQSLVSDWIYIIESITENGDSPPSLDVATQKEIIRRDGDRCCITGKTGSFWDPLVVLPILPVPSGWTQDKNKIYNMLGAFFGPPYRDWWLSYANDPKTLKPFHKHWLVRRSAAKAFSEGRLRLDRLQPSMIEYEIKHVLIGPEKPVQVDGLFPLLGDHSRSNIEKVDPRFVGTQARLSRSIRLLHIAKENGWDVRSDPTSHQPFNPHIRAWPGSRLKSAITSLMSSAFLTVWTLLPSQLRIGAYELLRRLGERHYGRPDDFLSVQRLPFGMYLKYHGKIDGFRNEFNALHMVRQFTSIPVPKPLDVVSKPTDEDDPFSLPGGYLLITRVPGVPLSDCQDALSDNDCREVALQMRSYVSQLREIPKKVNPDFAMCNTLGSACRDPRIQDSEPVGPFADEAAFSQELRFSDDRGRRGHKIVFTHADLNPRNILVDRVRLSDRSYGWRVTGIVDWETAGYYPEYWDYTKAIFEGFRWSLRYNDLVQDIFKEFGDYSRELDVERRSWEAGDGI